MKLLPSKQTTAQVTALRYLLDFAELTLREPCNCGSQPRHNNGGNYHEVISFKLDAGQVFRTETFTGDYGPPDDWKPVTFSAAVDEIADLSAKGW